MANHILVVSAAFSSFGVWREDNKPPFPYVPSASCVANEPSSFRIDLRRVVLRVVRISLVVSAGAVRSVLRLGLAVIGLVMGDLGYKGEVNIVGSKAL